MVSDEYLFYYNFCEIEQLKLHFLYSLFNYDDNFIFNLNI